MKYVTVLMLVMVCGGLQAQNLPRILNAGDTAVATAPLWIQSVDSEINQRIESKQLRAKLDAYVKKTQEIEALQSQISRLEDSRDTLQKQGAERYESAIRELSAQIDGCNAEVTGLRADVAKLGKQISRLERTNRGWRRTAIAECVAIAGALLLLLL